MLVSVSVQDRGRVGVKMKEWVSACVSGCVSVCVYERVCLCEKVKVCKSMPAKFSLTLPSLSLIESFRSSKKR